MEVLLKNNEKKRWQMTDLLRLSLMERKWVAGELIHVLALFALLDDSRIARALRDRERNTRAGAGFV